MINIKSRINNEVLDHFQSRLEEIDHKKIAKSSKKIHKEDSVSNIHELLGFFEEKVNSKNESVLDERENLLEIFEESIQKALIATKKSENYDDFADLTVLYFIRDADRSEWSVQEIEEFLQKI